MGRQDTKETQVERDHQEKDINRSEVRITLESLAFPGADQYVPLSERIKTQARYLRSLQGILPRPAILSRSKKSFRGSQTPSAPSLLLVPRLGQVAFDFSLLLETHKSKKGPLFIEIEKD